MGELTSTNGTRGRCAQVTCGYAGYSASASDQAVAE